MPLLEEQTQPEITIDATALEPGTEPKQRRRMLLALALLLCALILVLVKDRDFWFPASVEEQAAEEASSPGATQSQPHTAISATPVKAKQFKAKAHRASEPVTAASAPPESAPDVTNRAVLPPLEVEVVAGDQHQTIRSGNNPVKLDLGSGSPPSSAASESGKGVTSAAERVRLSPGTAQVVSRPVEPTYPMLAKQMKVQGAVVLKVLIGREGNIQNLSIVSGPAILSAAAREAVMQWRFKPYYIGGQPVETEARVTVNFTISTQ
jgi:periplasmic protein TonB